MNTKVVLNHVYQNAFVVNQNKIFVFNIFCQYPWARVLMVLLKNYLRSTFHRPSRKLSTIRQKPLTGKYKKVTHCIFDLDGTLINSEIKYHILLRGICKKLGSDYTKELEEELFGGTDREICTIVAKKLKLHISPEELERKLKILSRENLPNMPLQKVSSRAGNATQIVLCIAFATKLSRSVIPTYSGAERLLQHLHDTNVPTAIATNSTREVMSLHEKIRPQFFALFHHTVCKDEVCQGKPHPEIYIAAANMFPDKPSPEKCLVFEDSLTGVKAGRKAGMQVVMITNRDTPIDYNKYGLATMVINSLLAFNPECFGLPPFKDC